MVRLDVASVARAQILIIGFLKVAVISLLSIFCDLRFENGVQDV